MDNTAMCTANSTGIVVHEGVVDDEGLCRGSTKNKKELKHSSVSSVEMTPISYGIALHESIVAR